MDQPETIGKYEVLETIGRGGFGVVFKARDPFIKRTVAIKVCTSTAEDLGRRFLREAEVAGNLQHRNIVTVFEFGYADAGPYIVQEYLEGEDLKHLIERRAPLSTARRLDYLLQIARGLAHAHEQGILHRDIKPANVRVLDDGLLKILDFGIAKVTGAETQLTQTGKVLGTAGYLSPEQILGEPVDHRSDVFSFGVLAYELLLYRHPFPGSSITEILRNVVRGEPDRIDDLGSEISPAPAELIRRCLAKRPEDRPGDVDEVASVLAEALAAPPAAAVSRSAPEDPGAAPTVIRPPAGTEPAPPERGLPAAPAGPARRSAVLRRLGSVSERLRPWWRAHWRGVGLAAAAVVALALAVWIAWFLARPPAAEAPAPTEPPVTAPPAEPVEGRLLVDAAPWGRITRIVDSAGREFPVPPDPLTPCAVRLPPGQYRIELVHPDAEGGSSCNARVGTDATASCSAVLVEADGVDYFREAGWWD